MKQAAYHNTGQGCRPITREHTNQYVWRHPFKGGKKHQESWWRGTMAPKHYAITIKMHKHTHNRVVHIQYWVQEDVAVGRKRWETGEVAQRRQETAETCAAMTRAVHRHKGARREWHGRQRSLGLAGDNVETSWRWAETTTWLKRRAESQRLAEEAAVDTERCRASRSVEPSTGAPNVLECVGKAHRCHQCMC